VTARWVEAAALVVLAWILAGPVSARFAHARWGARFPVGALVVWQAVGLAGGLAVLTGELTIAAGSTARPWRSAVGGLFTGTGGVAYAIGVALFAVSLLWLLGVLVLSFARAARLRAEHRALVRLLSAPADVSDVAVDVIDTDVPFAYSVPGRSSRVVMSKATTALLTDAQLAAVVAHERAHLTQRHSLLVQPFVAWQRSLPMLAAAAAARWRVEQLVEMVCDDAAVRAAGADAVSGALAVLLPDGVVSDERIDRLSTVALSWAWRAVIVAAAVVLVVLPPLVLVALPF